jgi:hypothetical protein
MLNTIENTAAYNKLWLADSKIEVDGTKKLEELLKNAQRMPHKATEEQVRKAYQEMQERIIQTNSQQQATFEKYLKVLNNALSNVSIDTLSVQIFHLWTAPGDVYELMSTTFLSGEKIKEAQAAIAEWFDIIDKTFILFIKKCEELKNKYSNVLSDTFLLRATEISLALPVIQQAAKEMSASAHTFIPTAFVTKLTSHHQALDKLLPAFRQAVLDQQLIEESKKKSATLQTPRSGNSDISPYARILIKRAREYKTDLLKHGLAVPATLAQSPGLTAWFGQFEKLLDKIMTVTKNELKKSPITRTLVPLIQQVLEHINVPLSEIQDSDKNDYAILWNYKPTLNRYQQLLQDLQKQVTELSQA